MLPLKGVNTFLATPLGKGENQSAAMASKISEPSEVDAANIQRPTFDQLLADIRRLLMTSKRRSEKRVRMRSEDGRKKL